MTDMVRLTAYIEARQWALAPLHDVTAGRCSCVWEQRPSCKTPGKHPRRRDWQRPEQLVFTVAQLAEAVREFPGANWGLATGVVSGVWALDYDPGRVDEAQRAEVDALLAACWVAAAWVQRTGSGGWHFVFALPADFVPNNATGRLPAGFDVRGARRGESGGGQIVIAPSVTDKGFYEVLRDTGPVTAAPEMLIEMVRPKAPSRAILAAPLPARAGAEGAAASYVLAGIGAKLAELRNAWTGRNDKAIEVAYRVIELANTGYVEYEAARDQFFAAGFAHPDHSIIVPETELAGVWASAERHIGDRPADLSHVGASTWYGGDAIFPMYAPPAVPLLGGGPGATTGSVTGTVASSSHSVATQVTADLDPVAAMLAEMLDVDQLKAIVPPQPLVNGVLDLDTTAWLIGESGSFKSFVALDLAAHVGLGQPWRGHDVHRGEVLYIVAEGARGMRLRVDAWEREYQPVKGVRFLPRPVQANGGEWQVLVEACRRLRPALVIIDTQARVTLGLEENSNSDMSKYVAQADAIRLATGACVLTVHHLGRNGKNARGASALDGAQDAELRIERKTPYNVELHMDKQKDQAQAEPIPLRMRRSEGGFDGLTGRDLSSLVVDHTLTPMLGEPAGSKVDVGRRRALALFKVIADHRHDGGEGLLRAEIRKLFTDLPEIGVLSASMQRSAWHRAWALLVSRGRVMREGNSQRLGVFAPPDGAADGLLTMNTDRPDDAPPDGWSILWPASDHPQAVGNAVDGH